MVSVNSVLKLERVVRLPLLDSIYTERYMNLPSLNPGGYVNASISHVEGFKELDYLLAHGSGDDNVHYANSAHLLDMFVKGKVRNFRFRMFTDRLAGLVCCTHRMLIGFLIQRPQHKPKRSTAGDLRVSNWVPCREMGQGGQAGVEPPRTLSLADAGDGQGLDALFPSLSRAQTGYPLSQISELCEIQIDYDLCCECITCPVYGYAALWVNPALVTAGDDVH